MYNLDLRIMYKRMRCNKVILLTDCADNIVLSFFIAVSISSQCNESSNICKKYIKLIRIIILHSFLKPYKSINYIILYIYVLHLNCIFYFMFVYFLHIFLYKRLKYLHVEQRFPSILHILKMYDLYIFP